MLTDDQVRDRLVEGLHAVADPIQPAPDLLDTIHRHHVCRQLVMPLGLALALAASIATLVTWPSTGQHRVDRLAVKPTAATEPTTVRLFDYDFTLPDGYVVTRGPQTVDLSHAVPHQPVGGETASFEAGKDQSTIEVTVYRGAIADAESSVTPPSPDTLRRFTIAGHPATATTTAAGGEQCVTKENGRSVIRVNDTGPCGQETTETRVSSAPHEQVWVTSLDADQTSVHAMLEHALAA